MFMPVIGCGGATNRFPETTYSQYYENTPVTASSSTHYRDGPDRSVDRITYFGNGHTCRVSECLGNNRGHGMAQYRGKQEESCQAQGYRRGGVAIQVGAALKRIHETVIGRRSKRRHIWLLVDRGLR